MWHYCIRMEFQKTVNFLDTAFDNQYLPKIFPIKGTEVYDQSEKSLSQIKKLELKLHC